MKNTIKPLVLLFAYFLTSNSVIAQKDSITIAKKNVVYVQLLGLGTVSVNYDRVFLQKSHYKLAYRLGIETTNLFFDIDKQAMFLTEMNAIFGKKNHFFETGISCNTQLPQNDGLFRINIGPTVGYRFQKVRGGSFFRANMYPLRIHITKNEQLVTGLWWWFGISVGKSF